MCCAVWRPRRGVHQVIIVKGCYTMTITASPAWAALNAHRQAFGKTHLRELFSGDPKRVESLTLSFDGIHYDFSKQRMSAETLGLLAALATEARVSDWTERMFAGERINISEGRSVLHVALRRWPNSPSACVRANALGTRECRFGMSSISVSAVRIWAPR